MNTNEKKQRLSISENEAWALALDALIEKDDNYIREGEFSLSEAVSRYKGRYKRSAVKKRLIDWTEQGKLEMREKVYNPRTGTCGTVWRVKT